jgi:N-terminal domain of anti-restriction factor ArdC
MPTKAEQAGGISREAQLRAQVDRGLRSLLTEMQQGKSERLLQYLAFTARFHKYSAQNQMLIYLQRPDATFIAGYRRWQELGYQVRKRERGIRIFAPSPRLHLNPETQQTEEYVRFVVVSVFDASQLANLDTRPLPVFFTPLADDQPALYARLKEVAQADGIQITEEALGRTQGFSQGRRITLRAGLDSRNRVLTLLHEYAHELLHWKGNGREQPAKVKECHAEAVSYVVSRYCGLHNPFSADYLQHWGNTPSDLLAELDIVRRTSAYIIRRLEAPAVESSLVDDQPRDEDAPPSSSKDPL